MMLKNRSMPRATVIPVLAYPDVEEAVDWLQKAFGFTLRLQIGEHRTQLNVGDGCVVATRHGSNADFDAPAARALHLVMVRVEDLDKHHQQAKGHGARILHAPEDFPYGERQYTAEDFAGHRWTFSQTLADVDPAEWGGRLL